MRRARVGRLPWRGVLAVILASVAFGCAGRSGFTPTPAETRTVELMAQRLEVARDVAWIKFQNNAPVQDRQREAELLASLVAQGTQAGIPAPQVAAFFTAQIRASRQVQSGLIFGWRRGRALPASPPWDLRRDIRPQLDRISAELLQELAGGTARGGNAALADYAERVIRARGFSWYVARIAADPLRRASRPTNPAGTVAVP